MRKSLKYILSLLIPIFIVCFHIFSKELIFRNYFNNGQLFLIKDMGTQYNSIYAWIWEILHGNASIFYSFGKSLGGNMASTFGYYGSGLFNILYVFVSKSNIPFMTVIIYLLKIGISSLFMTMLLSYKYKKSETNIIIFSLMYSLSAYFVNYYFNTMWLDVLMFLPLVILGLEKLIKEGNILLYVISLSLSIISNFYIGYMLCIFCLIYFIYELFKKYKLRDVKKYKKIVIKFVISSLLGVGLSMFVLLPSYLNLREITRYSVDKKLLNVDLGNWKNKLFADFISRFFIGMNNPKSDLLEFNVYCGMLSIVLLYFYFINKNINVKEKVFTIFVLLLFLLSFYIPILNLLWHGGSFPNGYLYRFSFLLSFFLVLVAAKSFYKFYNFKIRYYFLFLFFYILLSCKVSVQNRNFLDYNYIIISSVFVILYLTILFIKTRIINQNIIKLMNVILIVGVSMEMYINFQKCFMSANELSYDKDYKAYYRYVCPAINSLDDDFYRVDSDYTFSFLDSFICNTGTITTSLSSNTGDLYKFLKNNGGDVTHINIYYIPNKTPILESLFGIKYVFMQNKLTDTDYELKKAFSMLSNNTSKNFYLYENPYALSLGYLIPTNYNKLYDNYSVNNSFESLNRFMYTLTGNKEKVMKPYKKKKINSQYYKININNDNKYIYFTFDYDLLSYYLQYGSLYINDEKQSNITSGNVGTVKVYNKWPNQEISVKFTNIIDGKKVKNLSAYYLDKSAFVKNINELKKNQLKNVKVDGNKVYGDINVEESSVLFSSIPYEKGWKVKVDGKKVKYEKIADEFIGIRLKKGYHKIEMKYYSHHFYLGCIVSFCSLILLIFYLIYNRIK